MTVRQATEADLAALQELYRRFLAEVRPEGYESPDPEQDLREVEDYLRGEFVVLLAEAGSRPVGFAVGRLPHPRIGFLVDLFVEPEARRQGHGSALVGELASRLRGAGAGELELHVEPRNTTARSIFERWGFAASRLTLTAPVDQIAALTASATDNRASFGSTHVQTDDETSVERAVRQFLPRLGGSARTDVTSPRNGWITVYDELCDRDRAAHRRFGAELSERLGVPAIALRLEDGTVVRYYLFERGRMVDEYLSVPTYYGEVSKADELSLAANPTLVSRLTGADPARVRAVVRTASSTAELPPAQELLFEVAAVMGLELERERVGEARRAPPTSS